MEQQEGVNVAARIHEPAGGGSPWIGRAVRRREDRRLLRGEGRYVADLKLPGGLAAAVLRSPHAHARLLRLDSSAARQQPGVFAVWDGQDVMARVGELTNPLWKSPPQPIQERARPRLREDLQPLLAIDRVRYVGEPVAIVVAENRYMAEDALELIEVEYEPLEVVLSPDEALQPGAVLLNESWGDNLSIAFEVQKGDPTASFEAAAVVVRERVRSHRYTGVPLETRGVAAVLDPHTGHLTVWSSTQVAHPLRDVVAALLKLPANQIRVVAPDVGGGFGIKGVVYPEEVLVPLLARELGRPVRWIEDRREHFVSAVHAREQIHDVELAAAADGRLLGLRDRILVDHGAYNPSNMINAYNTVAHMFGLYEVPAARWEVRGLVTNKTPHAPYRGAGRPEAVFAMERLMERLAAALQLDPAELRRRNLIPAAAMPYDAGILYRDGQPVVYDSGDYPALFERALELLDYEAWRDRQRTNLDPEKAIGIGLANYIEGTGVGPFESGSVSVDPSGRVLVATGSCSQGQGHATTFAQIVADRLQVPIDQIDVVGGDTATIPYGFGTVASRSLVVGGSAIAEAADRIREKALNVGAQLLETSLDDVALADGRIQVRGAPDRAFSLAQVAAAVHPTRARLYGVAPGLSEEAYFNPPTVTYASGVHAAVVEVDLETGLVSIRSYVVVHDCGRVVNPTIADGQVVGGVAQGIGGALFEDLVYDGQGQLLTASLLDYLLPTTADLPDLVLGHLEFLSPRNPLGVKGLGEGGAVGPPAALANAVEDALRAFGAVVRETPLGPNQVRALIRRAARSAGS